MDQSQVSKQHPIPQNFMDVEFKIVGDFTVRQFTYLVVTGLPMYALYQSPVQGFLKTIVLIILGILGFLLVFVPIDDRGMDVWIVNFFKAVYDHNRRVWRKTPFVPKTLSMESIKLVQGEMITLAPTASRRKLEEYLKGIKAEEPDEYDFNFAKNRYSYVETPETIQTSIQTLAPEIPVQSTFTSTSKVEVQPIAPAVVIPEQSTETLTKEALETISIADAPRTSVQEVVLKMPDFAKPQTQPTPTPQPTFQAPKIFVPQIKKVIPTPAPQIIKQKPVEDLHEDFRTSQTGVPGRRFVSFSSKEQELVLPVRGERVLNLYSKPAPTTQRKDIGTVARELRTLVREIKTELPTEEVVVKPSVSNTEVSPNFISGIVFDSENNSLSNATLALIDSYENEVKYARTDNSGKFIFKGTDTGNYKIKVLNPEIFKLNFDIINLNIERYPYPLIQILGKR